MNEKHRIFLEHFEPLKHSLWRFCLSVTKSYEDAKDLLQETIENAYLSFDSLKNKQAFLSWLFTIASRKNVERLKKSKLYDTSVDFENILAIAESNIGNPELQTDIKFLYEELEKLPYQQKEAVILSEIIGLTHKEIAEIQSTTTEAVKQKIYRAKITLKSNLSFISYDFLVN
mgnify:CR=1 FL=1